MVGLLGVGLLGACSAPPTSVEPLPAIEDYVPSAADLELYHSRLDEQATDQGLQGMPEYEIVRW
ncbi:hypothetical protein [Brooklawnia cerclae]